MRTGIGGNGGPPLYGNDNGWIAVARSMRSHAVVGFHLFAKPCDPNRGAMQPALAWLDLLMECRYTAGEVMNNGRKMVLRRGQLLGANLWLAQRWNWTPKATRTWLAKLELHGMISFGDVDENGKNGESSASLPQGADDASKGRSRGRFANVLTICNYDSYQLSATEERQVEKTFEGRLGAGCGQVAGRLTDIENARAKTKEQETREQGNQVYHAASARGVKVDAECSDAAAGDAPDVVQPQAASTLCVPPRPAVVETVATPHPAPPTSTAVTQALTGELFGPGDDVPMPIAAPTGPRVPRSKAELDALAGQLHDACNGALDNPVNCMALLNLSVPQWWIESGCDLDLDIIPTLKAAGRKNHGRRIRSWDFFTGMVRDAKAARERRQSMPDVVGHQAETKTEKTARKVELARARLGAGRMSNV